MKVPAVAGTAAADTFAAAAAVAGTAAFAAAVVVVAAAAFVALAVADTAEAAGMPAAGVGLRTRAEKGEERGKRSWHAKAASAPYRGLKVAIEQAVLVPELEDQGEKKRERNTR